MNVNDQTTPEVTAQAPVAPITAEETAETPVAAPAQPAADPLAPEHVPTDPAEVTPEPQPAAPTDYKAKFQHSASEALILHAQNQQKDALINRLTAPDAPTEAEIAARYPEYGQLDATSKRFIVDLLTNEKRQGRIDRQFAEQEADRRWRQELRDLTRNPKYAALANDNEFEPFVFSPKHKGLDINVLADAYLLRTGKTAEPAAETPPAPKAEALPAGNGGPRTRSTRQTYTGSELNKLRETNYQAWTELIGKIDLTRDIVEG